MNRIDLGEKLQQWHSSMSDPIYAVGSYYFAGKVHPNKEIVENCLSKLTDLIDEKKRMLKGEKVSCHNKHYGCQVDDLKKFAGYTNKDLKKDTKDLEKIVSEVNYFLKEDY